LLPSVAPEVQTKSNSEHPKKPAVVWRAVDNASSARAPKRCGLDAFATYFSVAETHASRAVFESAEVALWSK
jgi:hypothetical protein